MGHLEKQPWGSLRNGREAGRGRRGQPLSVTEQALASDTLRNQAEDHTAPSELTLPRDKG